jgi:4-hydroxy-3-polyprenylbenzoate decarboxylase
MGFNDLRHWLQKLEAEGELRRITAQVDWNLELGAVTAISRQKGYSGLLFENIKDYQKTRCRKVFTGSLLNTRQLAMMFGLPKDTHHRDLVTTFRKRFQNRVEPITVSSGPVKENIVKGKDACLYDFPVPWWNRLDGGRYINALAGIITRDPENGIQNVGIYRGMILDERRIAQVVIPSQHIGQHLTKYGRLGKEMPVAAVYGWDPSLAFCGCAPVPRDICEYDVMGSIRQEPVELVKCETSDLEVPATAEIVIEGFISPDPETYEWEGPLGEYTGYYCGQRIKRPVFRVECITHRHDPIFVGTLASSLPGQPGETASMMSVTWAGMVWEVIERAGIPGLLDVRFLPPSCETTVVLKIHKTYRGQSKQIACALAGSSMPFQSCKNIIVVDDDIDIYNSEAIQWAIDYRVNPMENSILVLPGMPNLGFDPSIRFDGKEPIATYGGGVRNRMIIDATKIWDYGRREEWINDFYPPTNMLADEEKKLVENRWREYGLK